MDHFLAGVLVEVDGNSNDGDSCTLILHDSGTLVLRTSSSCHQKL